jgi:hypothetical protein
MALFLWRRARIGKGLTRFAASPSRAMERIHSLRSLATDPRKRFALKAFGTMIEIHLEVSMRGILFVALSLVAGTALADIDIYKGGSKWATIESDGDIYVGGSKVGEIESDGDVYKGGSKVGEIESDGDIYAGGSKVLEVESDGDIYKGGSKVGEIESDGDIYKGGSKFGDANSCCSTENARKVVAALYFFDSGFF